MGAVCLVCETEFASHSEAHEHYLEEHWRVKNAKYIICHLFGVLADCERCPAKGGCKLRGMSKK